MSKLVSIVIPVFNNEEFLPTCIKSVISQSYDNLEIILIDDGSTDESGKICDDFARIDFRIKVIHQKNGGVSVARNTGLDIAAGEYILFVDSDDAVDLEYVEHLYNNIQGYEIAICGIGRIKQGTRISSDLSEQILNYEALITNVIANNRIGGYLCNKIFIKNIIDKYSIRFNPQFHIGEDMLWIVEYLKYCTKGISIPKTLYYYRLNENSMLQYSIYSRRFDEKNYESLYVNDLIKYNIKEKTDLIDKALAYRFIRSDMRLLFNMIVCRERSIEAFSIMKRHIKQYIKKYIQSGLPSRLESIVAIGMLISPMLTYRCGVCGYRLFGRKLAKYLN